jgi:hypothetical protein
METDYYSLITFDKRINVHFNCPVERAKFMILNNLQKSCLLTQTSKESVDKT